MCIFIMHHHNIACGLKYFTPTQRKAFILDVTICYWGLVFPILAH